MTSTTLPEGKSILVVDDSTVTREGLTALLQHVGFCVVTASNGQEALDLLAEGLGPDLIVLDMLLPVLDGWHFLEELKRLNPPPRTPVVIATAGVITREWAVDPGCAGFVKKPIEFAALLAEIRRCLGQQAAANV
jgi:two-component system chemotaxis response regulator CheY